VSFLLIVLPVLINVAFITLLERKVLRLSQYRLGPNKVRIIGILQPIADAVKLFRNQIIVPFSRNLSLFFISPILRVFLILLLWALAPLRTHYHVYLYTGILILVIISFGVYPLLLAGWASNRKYALLGGLRGVSQTISYEIRLALILLIFLVYFQTYSLEQLISNSRFSCIIIVCPVVTLF
jgi:NADH-quinone oxidoreductase subunit H